jgi:hypothetical protein
VRRGRKAKGLLEAAWLPNRKEKRMKKVFAFALMQFLILVLVAVLAVVMSAG